MELSFYQCTLIPEECVCRILFCRLQNSPSYNLAACQSQEMHRASKEHCNRVHGHEGKPWSHSHERNWQRLLRQRLFWQTKLRPEACASSSFTRFIVFVEVEFVVIQNSGRTKNHLRKLKITGVRYVDPWHNAYLFEFNTETGEQSKRILIRSTTS